MALYTQHTSTGIPIENNNNKMPGREELTTWKFIVAETTKLTFVTWERYIHEEAPPSTITNILLLFNLGRVVRFHFVPFLFSYIFFLLNRPTKINFVAVVAFFSSSFPSIFLKFEWSYSMSSNPFLFSLSVVTQRFWISNLFSVIILCVTSAHIALGFIFWLERIKFIVSAADRSDLWVG